MPAFYRRNHKPPNLPFADEFTGSTLSPRWLAYDRLGDQANGEVNAVKPANVRISGGSLLIDSKFEDVVAGDTTTSAPNPRTVNYSSGQVANHWEPFLYGTVTARAKLPGGIGLWPCIWMLGWGWQATQPFTANDPAATADVDHWEIDIAEFMNNHRTVVNCALHLITNNRGGSGEKALPFDATTRFMVYKLVWTSTTLTWYVDAEDGNGFVQLLTMSGTPGTDIPNTPGYVIVHTAIGGFAVGTPDPGTFPQTFEVDYVHITQP